MDKKNIVLIGMPSSGKSTVGKILAQAVGFLFIDTDEVILEKEKRPLRDIVNTEGLAAFLRIQEEAVLGLDLEGYVIATGGSVIYGEASMLHLKEKGLVVYLETAFAEVEGRLEQGRRFARNAGQSMAEVYREREPLYKKYADTLVVCSGKTPEEIASEIYKRLA